MFICSIRLIRVTIYFWDGCLYIQILDIKAMIIMLDFTVWLAGTTDKTHIGGKMNKVIVTGGAGFIGANYIHTLFADQGFEGQILNLDKLTYAGKFGKFTKC